MLIAGRKTGRAWSWGHYEHHMDGFRNHRA